MAAALRCLQGWHLKELSCWMGRDVATFPNNAPNEGFPAASCRFLYSWKKVPKKWLGAKYLEPKWGPWLWMERALFWGGWPSKIEVIWVPGSFWSFLVCRLGIASPHFSGDHLTALILGTSPCLVKKSQHFQLHFFFLDWNFNNLQSPKKFQAQRKKNIWFKVPPLMWMSWCTNHTLSVKRAATFWTSRVVLPSDPFGVVSGLFTGYWRPPFGWSTGHERKKP